MKVKKLQRLGNSRAVVIDQAMLEQIGASGAVVVEVVNGAIVLRAVTNGVTNEPTDVSNIEPDVTNEPPVTNAPEVPSPHTPLSPKPKKPSPPRPPKGASSPPSKIEAEVVDDGVEIDMMATFIADHYPYRIGNQNRQGGIRALAAHLHKSDDWRAEAAHALSSAKFLRDFWNDRESREGKGCRNFVGSFDKWVRNLEWRTIPMGETFVPGSASKGHSVHSAYSQVKQARSKT